MNAVRIREILDSGFDPVTRDTAAHYRQLDATHEFEIFREQRLAAYRRDYLHDLDLSDAVGTVDDGEKKLNAAFALLVGNDFRSGIAALWTLFAEGCDAYAKYQFQQELKLRVAIDAVDAVDRLN